MIETTKTTLTNIFSMVETMSYQEPSLELKKGTQFELSNIQTSDGYIFQNMNYSGDGNNRIQLSNIIFDNVAIRSTNKFDSLITNVKFMNLQIRDVTFVKCTFLNCLFENVKFVNCQFEGCKFLNVHFDQQCQYKGGSLKGSWFINSNYEALKVVNGSNPLISTNTIDLYIDTFELENITINNAAKVEEVKEINEGEETEMSFLGDVKEMVMTNIEKKNEGGNLATEKIVPEDEENDEFNVNERRENIMENNERIENTNDFILDENIEMEKSSEKTINTGMIANKTFTSVSSTFQFDGKILTNVKFSNCSISQNLNEDTTFNKCTFENFVFDGSITKVTFKECRFQNVKFNEQVMLTEFNNCHFRDVNPEHYSYIFKSFFVNCIDDNEKENHVGNGQVLEKLHKAVRKTCHFTTDEKIITYSQSQLDEEIQKAKEVARLDGYNAGYQEAQQEVEQGNPSNSITVDDNFVDGFYNFLKVQVSMIENHLKEKEVDVDTLLQSEPQELTEEEKKKVAVLYFDTLSDADRAIFFTRTGAFDPSQYANEENQQFEAAQQTQEDTPEEVYSEDEENDNQDY